KSLSFPNPHELGTLPFQDHRGVPEAGTTMARGARYSRTLLGRRSSSFTLILAALLTASVVLLMLLAFGIFSLPVGSDDRAKPDLRSRLSVHESYVQNVITLIAGGCPVIKGNKWSSTKWMRMHEYRA
ncbi:hypothetical protein B296_00039583, partial [Ensete ventricosum]